MSAITFGADARRRLEAGADAVSSAVAVTFGPAGRRVVIGAKPELTPDAVSMAAPVARAGAPIVSTDGATVARHVEPADHFAALGAALVRQAADRTRAVIGDGSTTATVLTRALVHHGLRTVAAGADPRGVGVGIEIGVDAVVARLMAAARPVLGDDETAAVAARAAHDADVGELVAEALGKVGPNGVITCDESHGVNVGMEFTEGMTVGTGHISPHMVTDRVRGESVLHDAHVLVCDARISDLDDLLPVVEHVVRRGRPLYVVAEDVQGDALSMLVFNHNRGVFKAAAVRAPALGGRRRARLEDIAVLTGARVIAPEAGLDLAHAGPGALGRAYRVIVTRHDSVIVGGMGKPDDVQDRVTQIERERGLTESRDERAVLSERLGSLAGGACVLRVGAPTDTERVARQRSVEDAVASARAALRHGVVTGGGAALLHAASVLSDSARRTGDEAIGVNVVRSALAAPMRAIADNAGADGSAVCHHLARLPGEQGYNAITGSYGDIAAEGVVDPVTVLSTALQNAASVAGRMLGTAALVVGERPASQADIDGGGHGHGHGHGH